MPPRRPKAEHRLERALAALALALRSSGAPWMVIGGIAVITRGVRRLTTDIDACVRGDAIDVDALLEVLARHRIVPRIDDASAFATQNLVLLVRHEPTGVDLDVSLAWSLFEHEALDASTDERFGAVRVPMASAEDLVVFKVLAARPRDSRTPRRSSCCTRSTSTASGFASVSSPSSPARRPSPMGSRRSWPEPGARGVTPRPPRRYPASPRRAGRDLDDESSPIHFGTSASEV